MVPGFTMSMKTRPLTIGKLDAYMREKSITIQGKRTMEEMRTFIWKNGRAEAQIGYNDDLIMSLATGCYVRDTALKFKEQGKEKTRAILNNFKATNTEYKGAYFSKGADNPYHIEDGKGGKEDISWLL